jgi:hypothetical protein
MSSRPQVRSPNGHVPSARLHDTSQGARGALDAQAHGHGLRAEDTLDALRRLI